MSDSVKDRPDAVPCADCGKPTWSRSGLCLRCRSGRPDDEKPAPPTSRFEHREPVLDDAGRLAEELPCLGCGYFLQGLAPNGACPECSTPIGQSIHGNLLRFCDPAWLRRLATGILTIILGMIATIVFGFTVGIVMFRFAASGGAGTTTAQVAVGATGVALNAVVVLGMWWLTSPDPGRTENEPTITARKLARWLVLAGLVAAPLNILGQGGAGASPMNPLAGQSAVAVISAAAGLLLGAFAQAGHVAGLLYLRQLFRRIPRQRVAGQFGFVAWGYGASQGIAILFGIGVMFLMPTILAGAGAGGPPTRSLAFLMVGGCVVGAGTLVFGVWAMILLIIARIAFVTAADDARVQWSGGS